MIGAMTTQSDPVSQIPDLRDLPVDVKRHALLHEVQLRLDQYGNIEPGAFVVVAVSGGADSVALLLAMAALGQRTTRSGTAVVRPVAVHVHHHLRESADADAGFVEALCGSLDVPFRLVDIDPGRLPGNVSSAARALRYHALAEQASQVDSKLVAVAHHAEDQLETMLMALCRGAGLDGLAGMPWARSLKNDVQLIRPLLGTRRAECESLCKAAGVQWVDDPTNRDLVHSRARLRHEVLPVLEAIWPDAARRTTATSDTVRTAAMMLERALDDVFGSAEQHQWQRHVLAKLEFPLVTAGLRRAAIQMAPDVADQLGHRQLDEAARLVVSSNGSAKRLDWPGGLVFDLDSETVQVRRK